MDTAAPVLHRCAATWAKFWIPKARLARLRALAVEGAVYRMTRFILHMQGPADEPWLDWHIRTWRASRQAVASW